MPGKTDLSELNCSLARTLEVVGDWWTLLIVRELMAGPRRYTDLADGLMTIPSNLLATRLREMEANGLIARRRLPAPASSVVVYELTDDGRDLERVLPQQGRCEVYSRKAHRNSPKL